MKASTVYNTLCVLQQRSGRQPDKHLYYYRAWSAPEGGHPGENSTRKAPHSLNSLTLSQALFWAVRFTEYHIGVFLAVALLWPCVLSWLYSVSCPLTAVMAPAPLDNE